MKDNLIWDYKTKTYSLKNVQDKKYHDSTLLSKEELKENNKKLSSNAIHQIKIINANMFKNKG